MISIVINQSMLNLFSTIKKMKLVVASLKKR